MSNHFLHAFLKILLGTDEFFLLIIRQFPKRMKHKRIRIKSRIFPDQRILTCKNLFQGRRNLPGIFQTRGLESECMKGILHGKHNLSFLCSSGFQNGLVPFLRFHMLGIAHIVIQRQKSIRIHGFFRIFKQSLTAVSRKKKNIRSSA